MWKVLVIMMLSVLAWTGRIDASVGRTQSFEVGALNRVLWAGGIGSARGETAVSFTQTQQFSDRTSGLSGLQTGRGTLAQTATASGTGFSTAQQTASIKGSQDLLAQTTRQLTGKGQQDLGVSLDTRLFKPNGVGTVNATQSFSGGQEQSLSTSYGTSSQSQSVDIRQSGSITTEINVDPVVRNTVTVGMHQSQTMN